jgi:hypothetical protein
VNSRFTVNPRAAPDKLEQRERCYFCASKGYKEPPLPCQHRTKSFQRRMEERPVEPSPAIEETDPELEVDFSQYGPPEALEKPQDVKSEVIRAIVRSALANIKEQIAHEAELRRAAAEEERRAAEAEAEAEASKGKGKADAKNEPNPEPEAEAAHAPIARIPSIRIEPPVETERRQKRRFGRIARLIRHGRETKGETSSAGAVRALAEGSLDAHLNTRMYLQPNKSKELPPEPKADPDTVYVAASRPVHFDCADQDSECISCYDDVPVKDAISTRCHHYCRECFERLISAAMEDESRWPPKCCLNEIPTKIIAKNISGPLQKQFKAKDEEFRVPIDSRIYCATPDCGLFIKRDLMSIATKTAKCARGHKMCTICRQAAHPEDGECPLDPDRQMTEDLAQLEGWRRCYRCKLLIEHREACQHMTCRCGAEFCYVCGARWKTCNCRMEDLAAYKARAQARIAERRQQEWQQEQEEQELQEALRAIEEFEREEALKAELLHAELERVAAQRRAYEAERRRQREAVRQAAMKIKHAELDKLLTDLNSLQRTVLVYSQDRTREEARTKSEQARKELIEKQNAEIAELQSGVANTIAEMELEWKRDFQGRVMLEQQLEKEYRTQLEKYWNKRPNRDRQLQAALRAYMKGNDDRFLEYEKWRNDELEKFKYHLEDELGIQEELLETTRLRLTEALADEELELRRKLKAERTWFELVTQERVRLLEESKELDRHAPYESGSGESSDVDEEFYDFDVADLDTPSDRADDQWPLQGTIAALA